MKNRIFTLINSPDLKFPNRLHKKLEQRRCDNALRELPVQVNGVDFSSNDYLGLSGSEELRRITNELLGGESFQMGSTGSRLISGNHVMYGRAEDYLREYYQSDAALIFNSGYDANIGFFSSVPQRGDVVLYDEYIHASIRDGLSMGQSRNFKFRHNDLEHLGVLLEKYSDIDGVCYVVTESVFSMDGDTPDMKALTRLCEDFAAYLIVDEAHAVGVLGQDGKGGAFEEECRTGVFARIVTFGKAPGVHGAVILGQQELKDYLVNFCRSLIYTTALPPHSLAAIIAAHELMAAEGSRKALWERIRFFHDKLKRLGGGIEFSAGNSAIATVMIPGNSRVKQVAANLQKEGFKIKPILSPTVPPGKERLRICLHTYNSFEEIESLFNRLLIFVIA